jgi:hypothetical protein
MALRKGTRDQPPDRNGSRDLSPLMPTAAAGFNAGCELWLRTLRRLIIVVSSERTFGLP